MKCLLTRGEGGRLQHHACATPQREGGTGGVGLQHHASSPYSIGRGEGLQHHTSSGPAEEGQGRGAAGFTSRYRPPRGRLFVAHLTLHAMLGSPATHIHGGGGENRMHGRECWSGRVLWLICGDR